MEKINTNNLSLEDFQEICRFCTLSGELRPIHETRTLNIFKKFAETEEQEDVVLPNNVCIKCETTFVSFENFINKCLENHKHLKGILNLKHELPTDDVEPTDLPYLSEDTEFDNDDDDNDDNEEKKVIELATEDCYSGNSLYRKKRVKDLPVIPKKYKKKAATTSKDNNISRTRKRLAEIKCDSCGTQFIGKTKLNKHYKESPSCMPKDFKCSDCDKAFNRKHKLEAHMRSHTKEDPFECNLCQKKFRFVQNLRRHKLIHKGIKPFKCEVCGKEFSRLHVKNEHMNIHTGNTPYICNYCGKAFKRYANHFIHVYRHKLINGEVDKKKDQKLYLQLQCEVCQKIFASRGGLANHMVLHQEEPRQKPFLCNDCGKSFVTNAQLESHRRTHTGVRPYECKQCGKSFRQKSAFNNHQLVHSGLKPFKCEICEKFFTQSGHLKIHMRTHSGEKPYACSFCDKRFALRSNLKVHTRIHTGETPYICSVCNQGYYDSSSLKKHKKSHTSEVKEDPSDNIKLEVEAVR